MGGYKVSLCHLVLFSVAVSPSWALNITDLVFGGNTKYLPAAFGDFNSDKLTDMFVVTEDGKSMKVLISSSEQPLMREPEPGAGPACTYQSLSIKSLVPGDFDGNGQMDVLLVSYNKSVAPYYQIFVLWGNLLNMTLECGSETAPLLNLSGQPLVMDVNGDMIPDLFGEDETSERTFWIFGSDRKPPKAEPMAEYNDSPSQLKHPSSHAFIDLNSDLAADLWVTTVKHFEIWSISNGIYVHNETITPWKNMTHIGQTSFMDVDLDGDIEAIVPVCKDAKCGKSSVFIYDFQSPNKAGWVELDVSFVDPKGNTWGYPSQATKSYRYADTITLRVGDYNLDGYPDFLVTLLDQNEKTQVILMENVACGDIKCKHPRKFVPKWDLFKDFGETVLGTFCDFQEDGTLDVLLVCKAGDGTYHLSVYKDPVEYDAVFVKELVLSPEECSPVVMFSRTFIPPPSGPCPYSDTGIDVKRLVEHVERTTGHAVMLDSILSTPQRVISEQDPRNVRNISPAMPGGDTNHMGFRRGAWSPFGVGAQGRCLLALATHDQRVNVVGRVGRKWEKLWDLSAHWHQHISSDSWAAVAVQPDATQLETYTARMHMLAISEFQWTPVYEDSQGSFSMLITLTAGGHVVFWRIPTNFTGTEEVRILTIKKTDITPASAMHWSSITNSVGYLIVGTSSGLVNVCYCQLDSDDALVKDLGFAYDTKDRMRINHMHLSHVADNQYLLLVAKHNILLASLVNLSADNLTVMCTTFSHIGKLAISGMVVLKNKNVYLSIKDGTMQHVVVNISPDGDVSLEEHGAIFQSEGVSYTGLMTSPNQTLWGILESVSVAFDHLVVREPTQISIYQVGCSAKLAQYVLESKLPLHSNADVLESLRITSCKEGMSPVLPIVPGEIPDQPLQLLKTNYWLTKMSRSVGITDEATLATLDEVEPKLQTSILEHWIMDTLSRFITEDVSQQQCILLSFSHMCEWIMKNGRDDNKEMAEVFANRLGRVEQEVCLVCQEHVQLDFLTHGKCCNGHTLPRCCRSLLLTKPTIFCPRCRVFAHMDAVYFESGMGSTCTYCDGFMVNELRGRRKQLQTVRNEGVSGRLPSKKHSKKAH